MAGVSQFIFYLYVLTIVFLACICEASVNQIRSVFRFLSTSVSHPIATARFIKLLDEKNPATRYEIEKREEPTECVVCLSRLEKGDKIRKLKCNHLFHKVCVDTWLQQDLAVACPICRATVLPGEIMLKLRQRENGDQADGGSDQEIIFLSLLQGIEGETGEELTQQGDHHQSEDFPTQEDEL